MNTVSSLLVILGSLGVFLFGMKVMSEAIQKIAGHRLRALMRTMTQNRLLGVFTGLLVTMLIQSSSATTVMVVSFVNAQLLTLVESIGIIMGANLGTTGTFWLVSTLGFKFSLSKIALPIIGVGLPMIFFKKTHIRDFGEFLIGFGILFLGLSFLKDAVPDIKSHPEVLSFIQHYTDHGIFSVLFFFVVGTILTIVVQSSSVAGAITITMAYKGWIDFPSAAAIILGENVGTTITANIAAIGTSTTAVRSARAHLVFNLIGVIWMLVIFTPFVNIVETLMPGKDAQNIPMRMALFHTLFNFCNIALLIGFVPQIAKFVERIVKDKSTDDDHPEKFTYLSSPLPQTGELNLAEAENEVQRMADLTKTMFQGFSDLFENPQSKTKKEIEELKKLEELSDQRALEITTYLLRCSAGQLSEPSLAKVTALLRIVSEFEDICDCCYRLIISAERNHRKQYVIPEKAHNEVERFAKSTLEFMDFYRDSLTREVTSKDMKRANELEDEIDSFRKTLRKESVSRIQDGGQVKGEILYIDVLNNIEKIGNHSRNILQALRQEP